MAYPNPSLWGSGGSYMYGGKFIHKQADGNSTHCQSIHISSLNLFFKWLCLSVDELISFSRGVGA